MQDKLGEPFYLGVEEVKEHEDGSATYTFHMDDNASKHITELGLKLVLYCGVASVDVADVYDWILAQAPKEDIRPMTDEERQRATEKGKANGYK